MNGQELFMSLNGYEEQDIFAAFGEDIMAMREKPSRFIRALVFVEKRREGVKPADAKKAALELTMRDIEERFAEVGDPNSPEG